MPTPAELRKIFAGAREAGLDDSQLRDLVEQITGQRSTRALNRDHTKRVIDGLVQLGARPGSPRPPKPSGRRPTPGVTAMISPAHMQLIQKLREQIGGDFVRDEYFAGVCRKVIHKSRPVTAADANRVVEALKRRAAWRPKAQA